jgi:hypothetical protein
MISNENSRRIDRLCDGAFLILGRDLPERDRCERKPRSERIEACTNWASVLELMLEAGMKWLS